jgi:hypothetical protein
VAKPFDLRKQLKLHDNGLLRRLFAERGLLTDFAWETLGHRDAEPLVARWEDLPEGERRHLQIVLHDVNELADEKGQGVLAEEVRAIDPKKRAAFASQGGLYDKALWAYLEAPAAFDRAAIFARTEALRVGQFANRWLEIPKRTVKITDRILAALQEVIRTFYSPSCGPSWRPSNRR